MLFYTIFTHIDTFPASWSSDRSTAHNTHTHTHTHTHTYSHFQPPGLPLSEDGEEEADSAQQNTHTHTHTHTHTSSLLVFLSVKTERKRLKVMLRTERRTVQSVYSRKNP